MKDVNKVNKEIKHKPDCDSQCKGVFPCGTKCPYSHKCSCSPKPEEGREECFYCKNNRQRMIDAGQVVCSNCKRELVPSSNSEGWEKELEMVLLENDYMDRAGSLFRIAPKNKQIIRDFCKKLRQEAWNEALKVDHEQEHKNGYVKGYNEGVDKSREETISQIEEIIEGKINNDVPYHTPDYHECVQCDNRLLKEIKTAIIKLSGDKK